MKNKNEKEFFEHFLYHVKNLSNFIIHFSFYK
jgi:hypothetical protein